MQITAKKKKRGFTLIELLVVIAIIGILASIVLVSLSGAKSRAKDARITSDMNQMRSTAELYYNDTGNYNGLFQSEAATVDTLIADIVGQGGSYSYTTKDGAYCLVAKLNIGSFWCVDSGLRSKTYAASPATCATAAADATCE